jgi:uncharacterized DUF497 family protein
MIRIESDPIKAKSNVKKHGISFEEAETALLDPFALAQEDGYSMQEKRWVLIGMSNSARLLTVVYTLRDNDNIIRLISARKSTRKEASYYA